LLEPGLFCRHGIQNDNNFGTAFIYYPAVLELEPDFPVHSSAV
jgi:hypothetical protein